MWVLISFILLKTENNKKIIFSYYLLKKSLFICIFALFISHEQCKRRWSKKKKKKRQKRRPVNVIQADNKVVFRIAYIEQLILLISLFLPLFMDFIALLILFIDHTVLF